MPRVAEKSESSPSTSIHAPISSPSEDLLDRDQFAQFLAERVLRGSASDSESYGLFGPWGSGKTSLKNLVVYHLREIQDQKTRPVIVDFDPWSTFRSGELIDALFVRIDSELASLRGDDITALRKGWSALRQVCLGAAQEEATARRLLRNGFALLTIALSAFVSELIAKLLLILLGAFALFLDSLLAALAWAGRILKGSEKPSHTQGQARNELRKALRHADRRTVVFLDDLDRLLPDEVYEWLRFLKSVDDLPNVTFVIVASREHLEQCIEKVLPGGGAEYLERVVHLPVDLPPVQQALMPGLIADMVGEAFDAVGPSAPEHLRRFVDEVHPAAMALLSTPRALKKYIAGVRGQLQFFLPGQSRDLDPADLAGLELLRLQVPNVYALLPNLRTALTTPFNPTEIILGGDRRRSETVGQLMSVCPAEKQEVVRELMGHLFPNCPGFQRGMKVIPDEQSLRARKGVGLAECFDRYFVFSRLAITVREEEIDTLASDLESLARGHSSLGRLRKDERLSLVLPYLIRRPAPRGEENCRNAVRNLVSFMDSELTVEDADAYWAWRAARWAVSGSDEETQRSILLSALEASSGLGAVVTAAWIEEEVHAKKGSWGEGGPLRSDTIEFLQASCVERIRRMAETASFLDRRDLGSLLFRWRDWTPDETEVVRWVGRQATSNDKLGKIINALVSRGYGRRDGKDGPIRVVDLKSVAALVTIDTLRARLPELLSTCTNPDEREAFEALDEALTDMDGN